MLNAIVSVGKTLRAAKSKVDNLVKNQKFDEIVKVVFDFDKKSVEFSSEVFDESKLYKYFWIGNNPGTLPQTRLTTDLLERIFLDSIYNIYVRINECQLKQILKEILDNFFGDSKKVINFSMISDFSEFVKELPQEADLKNLKKAIKKEYFEKKYGKNKKILFTVVTRKNGKELILAESDDYKNFVLHEQASRSFEHLVDGVCHSCGRHGKVTFKFKTLTMKFFINDKISFASGLHEEGFSKNYTLCPDCYEAFSAGERFILDNLKSRLGECPVYIIPEFYTNPQMSSSYDLVEIAKDIDLIVKSLNEYDAWKKFRNELRRTFDEPFLLNFLFAEKSNSAFKIKKLIQDVTPSRLKYLFEKLELVSSEFSNLFQNYTFNMDFRTVFAVIPVRKQVFNEVYNIYESLLVGKPLSERWIISKFLEALRMRYFETYGSYYNFSRFYHFEHLILLSNAFHRYLKELEILEEVVEKMDEVLESIDKDLAGYVAKAGYDKQKLALFLAGVLVAEIAKEQWKSDNRKQILDIINFNGMSLQKLKVFVTHLFEKLKQYKCLNSYTEKVYGLCKEYIDVNESDWKLSPQENVYYILSGYAFKTMKYIASAEGGKKDE